LGVSKGKESPEKERRVEGAFEAREVCRSFVAKILHASKKNQLRGCNDTEKYNSVGWDDHKITTVQLFVTSTGFKTI
jgi:hypothetical protein